MRKKNGRERGSVRERISKSKMSSMLSGIALILYMTLAPNPITINASSLSSTNGDSEFPADRLLPLPYNGIILGKASSVYSLNVNSLRKGSVYIDTGNGRYLVPGVLQAFPDIKEEDFIKNLILIEIKDGKIISITLRKTHFPI